jgi:hypothetical protein
MTRRSNWVVPTLALMLASPALSGCQSLSQGLGHRAKARPTAETADDDSGSDQGQDGLSPAKGFFHPTRLSGALSSEGREIERDLGVQ